ncbi:E3 ubiquitin-protein ligase MIB2 isoform X1 [Nematostella vectensis]|uniref:E3 ubiquitin-protein ligase MIB2 isoform X1 n=1 Tax=Nematostella vectensis TaxID=45351 RepID=UPI002077492C|nr:E3 ubiquitin-protein ligase MIB2 isoform X1 [Nematostella vectensis]
MEAGIRVVRGPDWKWGNQDGGEGSVGTVVVVGHPGSSTSPDKTVIVQWDTGNRTNYRCGYQGVYDLYLYDNGQIGVEHSHISCSECHQQGIKGMRWQCADCEGYNLCTACYMGDKHELQHGFYLHESPDSSSVPVGKRYGMEKCQSRGIFKGAQVARGLDWDWGDQDGGIGKVDLTCVNATPGGYYYREHLPKVGYTQAMQSSLSSVHSSPLLVGDQVKMELEEHLLKSLQCGHGNWNEKMRMVYGKVGTVHRITENGDIRVQYPGVQNRWTFNPAALVKVEGLQEGDMVLILNDAAAVRQAQAGHGEWTDSMSQVLGKTGRIVKVYADGDVSVAVGNHLEMQARTWTLNPIVLTKQTTAHDPTSSSSDQLIEHSVAGRPSPSEVDMRTPARVPVPHPPQHHMVDPHTGMPPHGPRTCYRLPAPGPPQHHPRGPSLMTSQGMLFQHHPSPRAAFPPPGVRPVFSPPSMTWMRGMVPFIGQPQHSTPISGGPTNQGLGIPPSVSLTQCEQSSVLAVTPEVAREDCTQASLQLEERPSNTDGEGSGQTLPNEQLSSLHISQEDDTKPTSSQHAVAVQCCLCDKSVDCKFMPCGHSIVCYECGNMFKKCYKCKVDVESIQCVSSSVVQECIVCSDVPASVTFEPCAHKLVCADCAVRMKKCIKCQEHITCKIGPDGADLSLLTDSSSENSLTSLQAKLQELEDKSQCPICMDKPRTVAFLCGHGTCSECCQSLRNCPFCRKPIEKKINLFC